MLHVSKLHYIWVINLVTGFETQPLHILYMLLLLTFIPFSVRFALPVHLT